MSELYLFDFEDSFTLNIYSELKEIGLSPKLIDASQAKECLEKLVNIEEKTVALLGPGPGHPNDRKKIVSSLVKIMRNENIFVMGVCLGHQLVARALGIEVVRSSRPAHGEVESYPLSDSLIQKLNFQKNIAFAQRYNSLAPQVGKNELERLKKCKIECLSKNGESYIFSAARLLTYQFHPESVGTSFRSRFFMPLKNFLL